MKTLTSLLIFFSQAHATAGLISLEFQPVSPPYQVVVDTEEVSDYAIWGTAADSTGESTVYGSGQYINPYMTPISSGNPLTPRGPLSPARWNYLVDGTQVYGGLAMDPDGGFPVIDTGFSLTLTPDPAQITNYEIWVFSWNATSEVRVTNLEGEPMETLTLNPYDYGMLLLSGQGEAMSVSILISEGPAGFDGANVLVGSAFATVQSANEPQSWLPVALIVPTLIYARRMKHGQRIQMAT